MKKLLLCSLLLFFAISLISATTLTIRPTSQGLYHAWNNVGCSAGVNEWQCVDENPASTVDYLWSTTSGAKETFNFTDTGLTTEKIYSVDVYYYAKRYSSSRIYFASLIRANSKDYSSGGNLYAYSSYYYTKKSFDKNPATNSSWTVSDVDNLEAGMWLNPATSSYFNGAYIAQLYADVDYDAPNVYPDLNLSSLSIWEFVDGNGTNATLKVTASSTVKNVGADTADVSTTRLEGLSTNDEATPVLKKGQSKTFTKTYNCTAPHTFTATADVNNVLVESNENNNQKSVFIDCII